MIRFSPLELLGALARHEVRFVVIGGVAATMQGSPSVTVDLDVCYERSPANLERLAAALRELRARLRDAPADLPFRLDAATLGNGDAFTFQTDRGPLDVLGTPAGTSGYADLVATAATVDLGGFAVLVCSLDDLIRMKEAAGRPKDRVELEILAALRDELEDRS